MCEQTEINYLDGDVVWVKLGSYWWPGQVIGFEKLPEDIKTEFKKKPLIAAVKFFQEDKFEFVKNYQQIYKYNCTHKEDFIRKGLDKFRAKSKDGSNYMNKFPEDVKTAEELTDGDPNIISDEKFNPEEKPDISGLFGEKKITKKKRNRDDLTKKNNEIRRVTHPRFSQRNDHEIHIRQQPASLPSTSSSSSSGGIYPCHVCGFTTTRVNVIICHLKNHRQNKDNFTNVKTKNKSNIQPKPKHVSPDTPKRKYTRKSGSTKNKTENTSEYGKRKYFKQTEKSNKKKKSDPELREKLLADWNVDSDEDEPSTEISMDVNSIDSSSQNQSNINISDDNFSKSDINKSDTDNAYISQETEKLLKETDDYVKLDILKDESTNVEKMEASDYSKTEFLSPLKGNKESFHLKKTVSEKSLTEDKDDKKSRLSCFDFNEDDIPEPNISSVRKIPRNLGSKNMSIKKEFIKEFEMSQALKNDLEKSPKEDDKISISNSKTNIQKFQRMSDISKEDTNIVENEENDNSEKNEQANVKKIEKNMEVCETQVEILEILEVDKEAEDKDTKLNAVEDEVFKLKMEENSSTKMHIENDDFEKTQLQDNFPKKEIEREKVFDKSAINEEKTQVQEEPLLENKTIIHEKFQKNEIKETNDNECENIKCSTKEKINIDSLNISKDDSCTTDILNFKPEQKYVEKESISNILMSECEIGVSSSSVFKTQNDFDVQSTSNFKLISKNLSQDESKSTSAENNLNSSIKKRRGRPRKDVINTGEITSDNEQPKFDNAHDKMEIINFDDKKAEIDSDYFDSDRIKSNQDYQSPFNFEKFDCSLTKTDKDLLENDKLNEETKIDIKEDKQDILNVKDVSEQIDCSNVEDQKIIKDDETIQVQQHNDVELLPPKKSQIKKFELSKINSSENNDSTSDSQTLFENSKLKNSKVNLTEKVSDKPSDISLQIFETIESVHVSNTEINIEEAKSSKQELIKEVTTECAPIHSTLNTKKSYSPCKNDDVGKCTSSITSKFTKAKFNDYQFDPLQDELIKTLEADETTNSLKIPSDEKQKPEINNTDLNNAKKVIPVETTDANSLQEQSINTFSITDNFDSIEVVVTNNAEMELKSNEMDSFTSNNSLIQTLENSSNDQNSNAVVENTVVNFNENLKVTDDSANPKTSLSSSVSSNIDVTIPVKKREKPRIIKNVALKEPMILKTKSMEKYSGKIGKHKLESDNINIKHETKGFPKTKVMKMETVISNSKNKSQPVSGSQTPIMMKKTQTHESADNIKVIGDIRNEKVITDSPKTVMGIPSEKYIQQSSQSLVDMELDISSIPFVLSEDVLTPESIEQMPVLISSVLPTIDPVTTLSSSLPTKLITPAKQIISANKSCEISKDVREVTQKKKSGTPTILKNKSKAKPTITSIKTIVPPSTSTIYKGTNKVNTQALKMSLSDQNQKTSGKYVIVQTSGSQQAYSTHQKVALSTNKGSTNTQIVQQGGKVVILTSPQSLKAIGNNSKVQRIFTNKQSQPVYTTVSPSNYVGSRTVLTSKVGEISPSLTSKVSAQKILGQQHGITSKSVLSQLPGTITKSQVLGTLPQGIITKEGIFTSVNSSTFEGKSLITPKAFVMKGSPQSTSKNLLTPITQTISGKTILSSQGIISKGTVLTHVTGSQIKALAPKNLKGNRVHQPVQRKVHVSTNQKCQKIPISSLTTQSSTNFKTSNNLILLQNTEMKTIPVSKNLVKQSFQKQLLTTTSPQQKDKVTTINVEAKTSSPVNVNRFSKLPDKTVTDKVEESVQSKVSINNESSIMKTETASVVKANKGANKNVQKKLLNLTNSTATLPLSASSTVTTASLLESISHENIHKKEEISEHVPKKDTTIAKSQCIVINEPEKVQESKVPTQTQIMALPTENTDGSQTYVLVTIDDQGHIIPLDNNTIMSLDGTSNLDGSKTIYIDSNSLNESGNVDNIVLQIDNATLSNPQSSIVSEPSQAVVTETLSTSEPVALTTNQDILAAALANTDFQHEIGITETVASTSVTNLTQTSLINQTILQSTIIPPTEPISSPLVLETSLTLNQPIMTPLEVPSNLSIQSDLTPATSTTTVTSVDLPSSETNQNISYVSSEEVLETSTNIVPKVEQSKEITCTEKINNKKKTSNTEYKIKNDMIVTEQIPQADSETLKNISYSISIPESDFHPKKIQTTPSMPIVDDTFNENNGFHSSNTSIIAEENLRNFVTKQSEELVEELTENNPLQENETLSSENILNDQNGLTNKMNLEEHEIVLGSTEDDCVSSQEVSDPVVQKSEEKFTTESVQCSIEKNKTILNNVNENNKKACTVSSEFTNAEHSHVEQIPDTDCTKDNKKQTLMSNQALTSNFEFNNSSEKEQALETLIFDKEQEKLVESREEEVNIPQTSDLSQTEFTNTNENKIDDANHEILSESYEQFISATNDVVEVPSQSTKSESWHETMKSMSNDAMDTDENVLTLRELPSQSCLKENEASQSWKNLEEINSNATIESFNEIMDVKEELLDNPNFPSQSYKIDKVENIADNMETDSEISQEANIPSQSNDVCADGIGTSSLSTNNCVLNEDETASSSYVPETPENQERDQDQESAISTSSYEIPPCEELNIASSSSIADTSAQHLSIHKDEIPEIPTSSYSLNPDSSSAQFDSVTTPSYENQLVVEQKVSTSYQTEILNDLEDKSISEKNEATSYYESHEEVTEGYYGQSRDSPEVCDSYLSQEGPNANPSPSYYDRRTEAEASQSYYSSDLNRSHNLSLQNIEATQSFYQDNDYEHEREEATSSYADKYSIDYAQVDSPLDRHNLVEGSMQAKSMDR